VILSAAAGLAGAYRLMKRESARAEASPWGVLVLSAGCIAAATFALLAVIAVNWYRWR
jgi:hypothetical protein